MERLPPSPMPAPRWAARSMREDAFVLYHAARDANHLARAADKPRKTHRVLPAADAFFLDLSLPLDLDCS
jgi:hypothetical protein